MRIAEGGNNSSPRHSRSASYYCEPLERILRNLKTQSGKIHRHLSQLETCRSAQELSTIVLDALRLLAILTGLLSDSDGMVPAEYLVACRAVLEECDRFGAEFSAFLQNDNSGVNWYRVAKAGELALPRAYILLVLGRVYLNLDGPSFSRLFQGFERIKSKEDLVNDMRLSCLAVGDPIKGLALNAALMKQIEPFLHRSTENWCLSRDDTIEALLEEFSLANRLWVRMRFTLGEASGVERKQLEEIVSYPIRLLSQVPGLDVKAYSTAVLPILLQHLTGCRDDMAQESLTESILASFPIEFHLGTAEELLEAVSKYNMSVNIRRLIESIIDRILNNEDEPVHALGEIFDMLWERISGLLLHRVETSRAEEAIMLCVPLLNKALEMKPFIVERVEKIVEFVELSTRQSLAYPDPSKCRILAAKIIDTVLELVTMAEFLFEMPSLFKLIAELTPESSSSCSLLFIGRLVKDRISITDNEKLEKLSMIIHLIASIDRATEEDDSLVNFVNILEYAADSVYNSLLLTEDASLMVENGRKVLSKVYEIELVLPLLIFSQKAINSWLIAKTSPEVIKTVIKEFRGHLNGKQVTFIISKPQFDSSALECRRQLSFYLSDSVAVTMVQVWARCIEVWRTQEGSTDLLYDAIVEMLMIFEENVTDHNAQCSVLKIIIHNLGDSAKGFKKSDVSVLVSKLHAYGKRLLKIDERRMMLLQILEQSVKLGGHVEVSTVIGIAKTLKDLLPLESQKTESTLDEIAEFNRLLICYMTTTEPDPDLGKIVYSYISAIESDKFGKILEEWTKLGVVLRPEYKVTDELVVATDKSPNIEDDQDVGAFSTFNPDLAEF